jgi:uncharacterized repeat protein (TIGR02543 family)
MKKNGILFSVVLLVLAGMIMTGCPSPNNATAGGGGDDGKIPFRVKAEGTPTTKIVFTFDKNVDLEEGDIIITPKTGDATAEELTGDKKVWELTITVITAGTISVGIDKDGIATGTKPLTVTLDEPPPPPPPPIGGNLGPVTAINSDTQKGWCTNGTDDIVTDLAVETLINAQYLKLVLKQAPSGGIHIIWQGDGNNWAWADTAITSDSGAVSAEKGTAWDDATKTFTIELSKALKGYETLKDSYKVKFFIAYYSPDFDGLGIVSADLVASPTPINFVFVTFDSDGGNFAASGPPVETVEVRYIKSELLSKRAPENPLKENFKFVKWVNPSNTEVTATAPITDDVTLKAVWEAGEPTKWTVSFNTDGGGDNPASVEVINGRKLGVLPAPPTKDGFDFEGWFDTTDIEYTKDTIITASVSLKAKWVEAAYIPTLTKPGFFCLGNKFSDGEKMWFTNGVDGVSNGFTEAILASAKYLIVEAYSASFNGSGGLQFAHQGGTNSNWDWRQTSVTGDWTSLAETLGGYQTEVTFYIVINLSTIPNWDETSGGGGAKIILNSPTGWSGEHFVFVAGYLTSANLTKPTPAVDVANGGTTYGWFALDVAEGK